MLRLLEAEKLVVSSRLYFDSSAVCTSIVSGISRESSGSIEMLIQGDGLLWCECSRPR